MQVLKKRGLTTAQVVFFASMVALDFGWGMVFKTALQMTAIHAVARLEMVVSVMLMVITRLMLDRFGTLIAYELAWGLLAAVFMPAAGGDPGFMKLVPAAVQGLVYDALFTWLRNSMPLGRAYVAMLVGGLIGPSAAMVARVAMGMPWATASQVLFGISLVTSLGINALGVWLALTVWKRVGGLAAVAMLRLRT
ncbi:conserved hypothetical protein [Solidesulfovibrio fructosivorans JJ]]|uniref:Transmembrane protein n=1 Tax=Solidesulfovibrio fructosivorans JJ] TaxID=596151 RepID=E1JVK7_SOLFR|nr:hypothetical protein [Solidesulfovibrio fructosivorans]EFL51495.1 conserved hypothetical protein [Solidesulfovibrio fructosivorans JJ]]